MYGSRVSTISSSFGSRLGMKSAKRPQRTGVSFNSSTFPTVTARYSNLACLLASPMKTVHHRMVKTPPSELTLLTANVHVLIDQGEHEIVLLLNKEGHHQLKRVVGEAQNVLMLAEPLGQLVLLCRRVGSAV